MPLYASVNLTSFKDEIQSSFMLSNLVWCHYGSPWLQESARGRLGVLAFETCRGFSLKLFGHYHLLTDVENEGAQCVGSAMRSLSTRLCTAGSPGSEELLIPIMILLLQSVRHNPLI